MSTTIKQIFDDGREVNNILIEGEVISFETRELRNGSYLVKAGIYDETSTILASYFEDDEPTLKKGDFLRVVGNVVKDKYNKGELTLKPRRNGVEVLEKVKEEKVYDDGMGDKHRVSLQNFSFLTTKRGAVPVKRYFDKAKALGHSSIAITDVGVVQAFPEIATLSKKMGIKPIYGMTALSVKDAVMVYDNDGRALSEDIVVFDVETTGLSARYNDVIEIGAAKISGGVIVDTFQTFVQSDQDISEFIQELTGITPELIAAEGKEPAEALRLFDEFVGDAMLAAHNANFDKYMLEEMYVKVGQDIKIRPVIDTLNVSRKVNEDRKRHNLGGLAKFYKVDLKNAHRADDDSKATAEILIHMLKQLEADNVTTTEELEMYKTEMNYKLVFPREITIWVKNQQGLKNLYEIVSSSHTKTLSPLGDINGSNRPVVTWDLINKYREGLIIGSGGYGGRLFELAYDRPDRAIADEMKLYDVIQIEPTEVATHVAVSDKPQTDKVEYLDLAWQKIHELAKKQDKYIVATDGAHYTEEEDELIHNILIYSQLPAKRDHKARRAKMEYPMGKAIMRTTKEMFDSFPYLTEEEKELYIITNTNRLADKVEKVEPIPVDEDGNPVLYTPKIDGIDEKFETLAFETARKQYGDDLPPIIESRLKKEIDSIVSNGFAVIYMISRELVKKSLEDGYLVGSRGSVGSSLAATMTEITEVNPMPPHYLCESCKWSIFFEGNEEILSGYDLPDNFKEFLDTEKNSEESIQFFVESLAEDFGVTDLDKMRKAMENHDGTCPKCKEDALIKEGQNIPFETFLGFNGDKVPDIDLNFSGVYQSTAHEYTKELFGEDYVFRAGTITTVADKTAKSFVRNYYKNHGVNVSSAEIDRLAQRVEGAKDSTGQHPGGILVVPSYMTMTDFSPYQYPANNPNNSFMTSHFDFNSIHDNILKLDILGHEAPTLLRYFNDYTGVDPKSVPKADKDALKLFNRSEEVFGVNPEAYLAKTGTLGLPELGTRVVQDVISETKPTNFGELITLSGLTHGTDVYYNNAQDLIKDGTATIREVIGCRDDIMRYLISKGMENSLSFRIMEAVRKGKGLTEEWETEMKQSSVPDWYIWSCNQIEYMFPRAHAAAYILDGTRSAYYKVHHPLEFTAALFSAKYNDENIFDFLGTAEDTKLRIEEIEEEIKTLEAAYEINAANKKKRTKTALNIALEAKMRGITFGKVRMYESHENKYILDKENNEIIAPFSSVPSLGPKVAKVMYEERFNGAFKGLRDLRARTGVSATTIEHLRELGCLEFVEETQPTLF